MKSRQYSVLSTNNTYIINTKLKSDQKSAPTKIVSQKKGGCFRRFEQ